jgi:hypothetical protein
MVDDRAASLRRIPFAVIVGVKDIAEVKRAVVLLFPWV